jgi:hypothetical protein
MVGDLIFQQHSAIPSEVDVVRRGGLRLKE